MNVKDIAGTFANASHADLVAALEEAYWRGHAARELTPTEVEHEALLAVLSHARQVVPSSSSDWEGRHLAGAVDAYDVAACKTPTGMRAHGAYVQGNDAGDTVCAFCKVVIHQARSNTNGK